MKESNKSIDESGSKIFQDSFKIIDKNQLLQRLDRLEFSHFHILVVLCLGINWILDGYEIQLISINLEGMAKFFAIDIKFLSFINSVYLVGCMFGSLSFGMLSAILGRRHLFFITLFSYFLSCLMATFQTTFISFLFWKFVTGFAVGGEYTAVFACIDELIPCKYRGRVDIIIDGSWHLGTFIASLLGFIIMGYELSKNEVPFFGQPVKSWQLMFGLGAILVLPLFYFRTKIPESPRWLVQNGLYQEAHKVIIDIEKQSGVITYQNKNENTQMFMDESTGYAPNQVKFSFILRTLYKFYKKRLVLALILITSQMIFYQGVFYSFSQTLRQFYHKDHKSVPIYLMPISIVSFLSTIAIGPYFDQIGRRKMIMLTYGSTGVLLLIVSIILYMTLPYLEVFMFLICLTFFVGSPAASSAHLTVSEVFPTYARSQVLALFFTLGILFGGFLSPIFFSLMIAKNKLVYLASAYLVVAVFMIVAAIVGYFLGVDAQNKSLEDIQINNQ